MFTYIQLLNTFGKHIMALLIVIAGVLFVKHINKIQIDKVLTERNLEETKKVVDVQKKVIKATSKVKSTNLNGIVDRMRKNKL